jgi:hypothetical protein
MFVGAFPSASREMAPTCCRCRQYTAIGTFTDSTSEDITGGVTWSSSNRSSKGGSRPLERSVVHGHLKLDQWCMDISNESIEILDTSWAREEVLPPYHIYLKMAYQLNRPPSGAQYRKR